MDMILKTTDLCKSFNGQMAVNNVSLNIRRNSVYAAVMRCPARCRKHRITTAAIPKLTKKADATK